MAKRTLTEALSYQLVQVCKAHRNKAESLLSEIGLHAGQEVILHHLWHEDGQTQSNLVDELCVQPATITKSLDRLESAGFVQRRTDADDRRVSRVYLTDTGRSLHRQIEDIWLEVEAASFGALTAEEQETIRRLLQKVLEKLKQ
jgi:DNA-binding MarR family transcriptional regulator